MWVAPRRWSQPGRTQKPFLAQQAIARLQCVPLGNDHVLGFRNVGAEPGTGICHLQNLVMLPHHHVQCRNFSHPQANPFLGWGLRRQSTFLANVEDAIASPVNIPASISRYQKTIQYASTPLDFIFGIGALPSPRATWHFTRAISRATTTKSKSQRRTRPLATTQISTSGNQSATKAISPSKEKSQHQTGLITRGHRVADPRGRDEPQRRKNSSHSRRGRGLA